MVIGIDGNEANEVRADIGERVGVNEYAFEILWGLYRLRKRHYTKNSFVIYLKNAPKKNLPPKNNFWHYKVINGSSLWILKTLVPELIKGPRPDVFFSPSHYLPLISLCPKVFTIHDLGYLEFSGQFKKYDYWQLKYWTAISISISKCIICVSRATRNDVVRHYPFTSKKLRIIYHGYDKARFNTKIPPTIVRRVKKKYNLRGDYILFLSTLKPSKNIESLIEAYSSLKKFNLTDTKLVIAGKKGWMYEGLFQKVKKDPILQKNIIFTDYIKENDKPALIAGSKVFVLASFWEGFGMDVLHAMACAVPVVASRVASLPEVGGKAATYVDPNDIESISKGIMKVLSLNKLEYNRVVQRGLKQVQKFSWEDASRKTLKVLEGAKKN